MNTIIKYTLLTLSLVFLSIGCKVQKPQTRTVYKFVKDTTVVRETKSVILPVRNVTILDKPCKDDLLVIPTQIIKNEKSSIKISSENGRLVVESNIDSIVNSRLVSLSTRTDVEIREVEVFVEKPYRDKWFWYSIGLSVSLLIWIFRKPIIGILRRFILPI